MRNSFKYLGYTFTPHGNIIGKDNETRFHRLMWRTDTLNPLLTKNAGYDYYEFNRIAGENRADIYFVGETKLYYVPIGGGMCRIDVAEIKKYIKIINKK
jgi:hypothetical protein